MITIIYGLPGEGKTFWASWKAIEELKKGKRKVYTNYPVIYQIPLGIFKESINNIIRLYNWVNCQLGLRMRVVQMYKYEYLSTYVWNPDYLYEGVEDSLIIIDEAWQYFSSRSFKNFSVDEQTAFAENRHNGNDFWLLSQHYSRIDLVIREIATFVKIKKFAPWFSHMPLLFRMSLFECEKDADQENEEKILHQEYLLPWSYIKKAYDTHWFRREPKIIYPELWYDKLFVNNEEISNLIWDVPNETIFQDSFSLDI